MQNCDFVASGDFNSRVQALEKCLPRLFVPKIDTLDSFDFYRVQFLSSCVDLFSFFKKQPVPENLILFENLLRKAKKALYIVFNKADRQVKRNKKMIHCMNDSERQLILLYGELYMFAQNYNLAYAYLIKGFADIDYFREADQHQNFETAIFFLVRLAHVYFATNQITLAEEMTHRVLHIIGNIKKSLAVSHLSSIINIIDDLQLHYCDVEPPNPFRAIFWSQQMRYLHWMLSKDHKELNTRSIVHVYKKWGIKEVYEKVSIINKRKGLLTEAPKIVENAGIISFCFVKESYALSFSNSLRGYTFIRQGTKVFLNFFATLNVYSLHPDKVIQAFESIRLERDPVIHHEVTLPEPVTLNPLLSPLIPNEACQRCSSTSLPVSSTRVVKIQKPLPKINVTNTKAKAKKKVLSPVVQNPEKDAWEVGAGNAGQIVYYPGEVKYFGGALNREWYGYVDPNVFKICSKQEKEKILDILDRGKIAGIWGPGIKYCYKETKGQAMFKIKLGNSNTRVYSTREIVRTITGKQKALYIFDVLKNKTHKG